MNDKIADRTLSWGEDIDTGTVIGEVRAAVVNIGGTNSHSGLNSSYPLVLKFLKWSA
jgi:hypothetical protein